MMNNLKKQYGPYALITGASSGIGKEFAYQLGQEGFNLVLIARREDVLNRIGTDLTTRFGIEVKTVATDLGAEGAMHTIAQETDKLEIGLLILNAALLTMGAFLQNNLDEEVNLLRVNSLAPLQLAHIFGNKMKRRHQGGILFVSSLAGHSSAPYQANYGASKAYLFSLGQALNYEFKKYGIDVTVLSPGLTDTEGIAQAKTAGVDFAKMPMTMMVTDSVVKAGLKALGKQVVVVPGFKNKLIDFMTKYLTPRAVGLKISGKLIEQTLTKELI